MKLTIKTIFGERTFDIPESVATDLIEQAEEACADNKPVTTPDKVVKPVEAKPKFAYEDEYIPAHPTYSDEAGYKGLLHIKCEKCGITKSFGTSRPLLFHKCVCRHNTHLYNLATVKVRCKCGESFMYKTNIVDPQFTMNCKSCGSPIDLELDKHGESYETVR